MENEEQSDQEAPVSSESTQDQQAEIGELPAKFKFEGKEWTPDELKKSYLLHSDYTQKTQQFAETRKLYEEHLRADLPKLMSNPKLITQFKQHYPKELHYLAETILQRAQNQAGEQRPAPTNNETDERFATKEELREIRQKFDQQDMAAAESFIDQMDAKFSPKYPLAVQEIVYSYVAGLQDKGSKMDEAAWEACYKKADELIKSRADKYYGNVVNKQKQANAKGKEAAAGGGIPAEAPKKMTIREATRHHVEQLRANA